MENAKRTTNWFGLIGSLLGFLALAAAFLSPWIAEAIDPPKKTAEEAIVDFASKLKAAAKARVKGEEYKGRDKEKTPSDYLPIVVIAVGMIGTGLGIASFLTHENKRFSTAAVGLGVSAAVVQWSIIIAAAVILILIVAAVLSALGIDLPSP